MDKTERERPLGDGGPTPSGLAGRAVIVTGAAAGIARATALAFGREGAHVVGADVDVDGLATLTPELGELGVDAVPVVADVTTADGARAVTDAALARFGRIDALVNVVGGSRPGQTIAELDEADWERMLALNLTSVYQMCRAVIPAMVAGDGGAVVNVSSGAGLRGMRRNPAYVAAKAGVVGLTRALAIDHGPAGVRVNCVAPGPVLTPLMLRNRTDDEIAFIAGQSLVGYVASPDEIAAVIVFLCSDQASYVMGQTIPVDGGLTSAV